MLRALNIWITNIIVSALWSWKPDWGGPSKRRIGAERAPDLRFAVMSAPEGAGPWRPAFMDDRFVAFTNTTSISPTDALLLTRTVKRVVRSHQCRC